MSDYRRLISYIYEYEGKEKGKNVGFVKLEARNGQCRLHVNVKRMYVGGNAIGVYLLGKDGEKTFLGNVFARGSAGEFRATLDAKNVEGSGRELDTYYGLVVHDVKNSWRSYKTVWEDAPVLPETESVTQLAGEAMQPMIEEVVRSAENMERPAEPAVPLNGGVTQEREEVVQSAEEAVRQPMAVVKSAEVLVAAEIEDEDVLLGSEDFAGTKEEMKTTAQETEPESAAPASPHAVRSPELENPEILRYLQESEEVSPDPELLWQELRKSYPKIQPFDYDGTSEVLTIRPQDIGRLPRESWIYGNNSFLLHGYYNFRYLILIRLEKPETAPRYLLGVPGHYYSSEKYMANMFGFPNFVLSKKQPPNDGRFGYWYTDVKMS